MTTYLKFKELHNQNHSLLIGNVWNVQSAKVFEKLKFQAIGTSSAAIAHSLGYEDGEQMPFSDLLFIVNRIKENVQLPLSVDIEFGYGKTAIEISNNIIELAKIGVVGINIEDSYFEKGERKLVEKANFSKLLTDIKNILKEMGVNIFINVRCDAFLLNIPNALRESKERIKKYEQTGVDGIFLPCITDENDISEIVSHTYLPLNVMCVPQLPCFEKLEEIGVKRISMGNFLNDNIYQFLENNLEKIIIEKSFNTLF